MTIDKTLFTIQQAAELLGADLGADVKKYLLEKAIKIDIAATKEVEDMMQTREQRGKNPRVLLARNDARRCVAGDNSRQCNNNAAKNVQVQEEIRLYEMTGYRYVCLNHLKKWVDNDNAKVVSWQNTDGKIMDFHMKTYDEEDKTARLREKFKEMRVEVAGKHPHPANKKTPRARGAKDKTFGKNDDDVDIEKNKVSCVALKKDGLQCTLFAQDDKLFCHLHKDYKGPVAGSALAQNPEKDNDKTPTYTRSTLLRKQPHAT
jgi:hypothetical protein